jgi:antitoxin YefM
MKTITASKARATFYRLIEETANSSEPIQITGKRANAVLVSEEDWRAMQETMYLLSIPGMRESIQEGMVTPVEECSPLLPWSERPERRDRASVAESDHLSQKLIGLFSTEDLPLDQPVQSAQGARDGQPWSRREAPGPEIVRQDEAPSRFGNGNAGGFSGTPLLGQLIRSALLGWRELDLIEPSPVHPWK